MPAETRELYRSPNGDRWLLVRDPVAEHAFIRHEANAPSGGKSTDIDIGAFFAGGQRNPEHQALLHLMETLVAESAADTVRPPKTSIAEQETTMENPVYKVVEVVGTSEESISKAIDRAVAKAATTLRRLGWFEVVQMRGAIENGKVQQYQVTLKVGFTLED